MAWATMLSPNAAPRPSHAMEQVAFGQSQRVRLVRGIGARLAVRHWRPPSYPRENRVGSRVEKLVWGARESLDLQRDRIYDPTGRAPHRRTTRRRATSRAREERSYRATSQAHRSNRNRNRRGSVSVGALSEPELERTFADRDDRSPVCIRRNLPVRQLLTGSVDDL